MDRVAQVDLDGFVGQTDELGGLRVFSKHASVSSATTFRPAGSRLAVNLREDNMAAYVADPSGGVRHDAVGDGVDRGWALPNTR
jgi:hypothetical protein